MGKMKIGILGQGYVGTAIKIGFEPYYTNLNTFDKFLKEKSSVKNLEELVECSDIIFVCLPTPMKKTGECDISIVGAVFLLRYDGALLLQLRDDKPNLRHAGMWVPPGGHIDADESVEEGTLREFLEETDYVCCKINWLQMMEIKHPAWPTYLLGVFCFFGVGF